MGSSAARWIGELANGHPEKIAASHAKPVLMTPEGVIGYGLTYGVICSASYQCAMAHDDEAVAGFALRHRMRSR